MVERVRAAEQDRTPGSTALTEAVARYLYKLMAYKDEYEVARLAWSRPSEPASRPSSGRAPARPGGCTRRSCAPSA